jgi:hypothetical protein
MSFEKPLTTTPESAEPKTPISDLIKNQEKFEEKTSNESAEKTAACLSPENQIFFNKMSESGKKIANQVYEGLYKIPGIKRVVGKLEIAYNQFWLERHEKKALEFKNKMDGFDIKIRALDQSKKEIESVIENLKQQNIPGVDSLQLKLKDIDQ